MPINYTMTLDRRNKLSVGCSGFYQQGYSLLFKPGKINGRRGFNPNINSEPSLDPDANYSTIDISSGVFYQHTLRNKHFYGGIGLNHLTRQKLIFRLLVIDYADCCSHRS